MNNNLIQKQVVLQSKYYENQKIFDNKYQAIIDKEKDIFEIEEILY